MVMGFVASAVLVVTARLPDRVQGAGTHCRAGVMRRTRRLWTDDEKWLNCLQANAPTRIPDCKIGRVDHLLPWRWNEQRSGWSRTILVSKTVSLVHEG